ncbi:NADH-quinone oxidoreductase subunit C [Rhabdothermincola salaria]|uniref:NADH-quinone oxidoreductase subunit C n=1 Tax=Rhabdothermincola salaria TaxID=2903142 RepID=UPI001E5B4891|nr:NADH-quinone oxidoreductase subunit C [Rhabdothermincola salaria]
MADDETTEGPEGADEATAVDEPETRHGAPLIWSHGQAVLHTGLEQYRPLIEALHDEGFLVCIDLTVVDYLAHPGRALAPGIDPERFEVVVNLLSHARRERVRVRVQVPESEPVAPSLFDLYAGTEAMEREAYDMFGVAFTDHPDLTRILMPEDWVGHPLRKDYDAGRIPVQFKAAPANR